MDKLPKVLWKRDFWSAEFYSFCLCHRNALCLSFSDVFTLIGILKIFKIEKIMKFSSFCVVL